MRTIIASIRRRWGKAAGYLLVAVIALAMAQSAWANWALDSVETWGSDWSHGGGWVDIANGANATGILTNNYTGTVNIGNLDVGRSGNGAYGEYVQNAGTVNVGGYFVIGFESSLTANAIIAGGTMTVANEIRFPRESSCTPSLVVRGGSLTGNSYFHFRKGTMTVDSGTVNINNDFFMGEYGAATLTINGGSVTVAPGKWIAFKGSDTKTVTLNGGTLTIPVLGHDGTSSGTVVFNGGTLAANNAKENLLYESVSPVKVKARGGTINAGGYTIDINASISEDTSSPGGGMKFCGGGTVTLSGAIGYTGGTTIEAGTTLNVDTAAKKDVILGSGQNTLKFIPTLTAGTYTLVTITGEDTFTDGDELKASVADGFTANAVFALSGDKKSLTVTVGSVSALVFPGATLADLSTHTLRARMKGDWFADKGVEATFFNRAKEAGKVTYQLQAIDASAVKAVKVEFTERSDGVYAKLADGNYSNYSGDGTTLNKFGNDPLTDGAGTGLYVPYDFRLVEPANAISVNFTHNGNNLNTSSSSCYGGGDYAVPYTAWVNMPANNDGTATINGATVKITGTRGSWAASALNSGKDLRHGYIDENDGNPTPTVTVTGVPYAFYRVVVYTSTDNADTQFGYVKINGVDYTGTTNATVLGTSNWGSTGGSDMAKGLREGVNYLVSPVLTGSTAIVVGHRTSGARGCIAAVQIVEVINGTYTAAIDTAGTVDFSTLSWDTALPASLAGAKLVVNVTEDATLNIDSAVNASAVEFNVASGKTLTLSGNTVTAGVIAVKGAGQVVLGSASQLSGIVKGDGTLVYDGVRPTTTGTDIVLTNPLWMGTLVVKGYNKDNSATGADRALYPQFWGSANSKIKWNGVCGYFGGCTSAAGWILEDLEADSTTYPALKKNDGSSTALTTAPSLEGAGTFADASNPTERFKFASAENFTGAINITSSSGNGMNVQIGGTAVDTVAQTIHVLSGATATVASGKTWTADGGILVKNGGVFNVCAAISSKIVVENGGTLNTSGSFSLSSGSNEINHGGVLNVNSGTLTLSLGGLKLKGTVNILSDATLEATGNDKLDYNATSDDDGVLNIYGTLAMGSYRWTICKYNQINLYEGARITGTGDSNGAVLDMNVGADSDVVIRAYGNATIEAPIRSANHNRGVFRVDEGKTLTFSGRLFRNATTKKGLGTLKLTYSNGNSGTNTGNSGDSFTIPMLEEGVIEFGGPGTWTPNIGTRRDLSCYAYTGTGSISVKATPTAEEWGKGGDIVFTNVSSSALAPTVLMYDGTTATATLDGTTATLVGNGTPHIDGEATLYDITFKNNGSDGKTDGHFTYKGVSSGTLNYDTNPTFNNDVFDDSTGVYIKHHPYIENAHAVFSALTDFTAVLIGQMSPTPSTEFIHFGSSQGTNQGLLIATTDEPDEVVIAATMGGVVNDANGVKVKIPNAASARHAYVVMKRGSVFTVYVDGIRRGTFTVSDGFALGNSSHSGIQVGSDFGGKIHDNSATSGYDNVPNVETETGVVNVIRVFDYAISEAQAEAVVAEYPYVSAGGLYTRTISADANFSATDAWAKDGDATAYALPEGATEVGVFYNPSATVTVDADAELTVNANLTIDTLTVGGAAALTFVKDGSHVVSVSGAAVFNSPVTVKFGALNLAGTPVQLGSSGSLCFDCSGFDISGVVTTNRYQLTGLIDRDDSKISFIQPTAVPCRTVSFGYNAIGSCYEFVVMPDHEAGSDIYYKSGTYEAGSEDLVVVLADGTTSTMLFPGDNVVFTDAVAGENAVVQFGETLPANVTFSFVDWTGMVVPALPSSMCIWTGEAGDLKASTAGNWLGNAKPTTGAAVYFPSKTATIDNDIDGFAPASITFGYGNGVVAISGNAITGVAAVTNLATVSHSIAVPVHFAGPIAVSQPALDFSTLSAAHVVFAGGAYAADGCTIAEHDDGYSWAMFGKYFFANGGDEYAAWSANTDNPRPALADDSELCIPKSGETKEMYIGSRSVVTIVKSDIMASTSNSPRICYSNGGEVVVTGEFIVGGTGSRYDGFSAYVNGTHASNIYKIEKATCNRTDKWTFWFGVGSAASQGTYYIGSGGINFGTGPGFFGIGRDYDGDAQTIRPWYGDFAIEMGTGNDSDNYDIYFRHGVTFNTDDTNGVGRVITLNARPRFEGSAPTFTVSGSGKVLVNSVASNNVEPPVTVAGTATLAFRPGSSLTTSNIVVNVGATLAVAESGTFELGGDLTLADGAILGFNFTESAAPVLDLTGKTVTLPENGTVYVNVSSSEGIRPAFYGNGKYTLTSGGKFTGATVSLAAGSPDWAKRVSIDENGDIVLELIPPGTFILVY